MKRALLPNPGYTGTPDGLDTCVTGGRAGSGTDAAQSCWRGRSPRPGLDVPPHPVAV